MTTLNSLSVIIALGALVSTAALGLAAALTQAARARPTTVTDPAVAVATAEGSRQVDRLVWIGLVIGCIALLGYLVTRAVMVGHAPWSNLHEFSMAFAAVVIVTFLALWRSHPIAGLAPFVALLAAGLIGFGLGFDNRIDPLVPALQQPLLLTIHVGSAVVAYAVAAVACIAAIAELAQRAAADRIPLLPDAATLRLVGHRAVLIGFPILTLAIALGSVWANLAWRSYWSNDPKELAAAATWLVFGAYLHVASRRDRWGTLAPWLIVLGFAGVLFTYIGAGLFLVGEHSYGAP